MFGNGKVTKKHEYRDSRRNKECTVKKLWIISAIQET
jgi:hypothetical protein